MTAKEQRETMLRTAIVAICALTWVASAEAAPGSWKPKMDIVTGQDWLDACQLDAPEMDALEGTIACDYYMRGVIQTTYSSRIISYEQNHVPTAQQQGDFYCAPAGTTMRERVAAITAYLARYPAFKVGPAPIGITLGLQATFPCAPQR